MSFFVYFNGQFSPYIYKAMASPPYKTQPVQQIQPFKPDMPHDSSDDKEFQEGTTNPQAQAYQKQASSFEKAKIRLQARDIMSAPLHVIHEQEPISRAIEVMEHMGFRHMPVLDQTGQFIGLLSQKEILRSPPSQAARLAMKPQVIVALDTARIQDVAHLMLDEKLNALPVMNYQHKLLGMITLSDILKFVVNMDEFKAIAKHPTKNK